MKGRGENAYLPHGKEAVVRSGVEDLSKAADLTLTFSGYNDSIVP